MCVKVTELLLQFAKLWLQKHFSLSLLACCQLVEKITLSVKKMPHCECSCMFVSAADLLYAVVVQIYSCHCPCFQHIIFSRAICEAFWRS